jgi:hypothetical protein
MLINSLCLNILLSTVIANTLNLHASHRARENVKQLCEITCTILFLYVYADLQGFVQRTGMQMILSCS